MRRPIDDGARSSLRRLAAAIGPASAWVFRYGSCHVDERPRDLDIVCLGGRGAEARCFRSIVRLRETTTVCNAHIVPRSIFMLDAAQRRNGGFYADKFALGAESLREGNVNDPRLMYWALSLADGRTCEAVRGLHGSILGGCPTFGRSLTKYLLQPTRRRALEWFLERSEPSIRSTRVQRVTGTRMPGAADFRRFWGEYARIKCGSVEGPRRVADKIELSLANTDAQVLREYFGARTWSHVQRQMNAVIRAAMPNGRADAFAWAIWRSIGRRS